MVSMVDINMEVSIHAPLTGGDLYHQPTTIVANEFQSTPPSREATNALGLI